MEDERRKENMDKLRKEMEKSKGETVVLSTGLKDKEDRSRTMMDEGNGGIEEEDDDDYERFIEEEDVIDDDDDDDDEDEEIASFSF